ncbi:MAG: efflux RND transporter periplasmic adaptor subunit [Deltaproteobacteria bacterium]|nr:efflux RND transporter periplasmic adaptor subunit [Deltaproteobacteria bacterium]
MTRPQKFVIGAAVVSVVLAAVAVIIFRDKSPEGPRVETQKVERGSLIAKVTASGSVSALVTVQVGSQVSGRIKEVLVDFNSPVKKGQVIARLDPQMFVAALEQARANLAVSEANVIRAQVQLADAERQYTRAKAIFDKQLGAQADVDAAQTVRDAAVAGVSAAAAGVKQANAALTQAQVNLDYCTVHSPIDGIVISRNVDVGQTVAASLSAPTLFSIAEDLKKMQVDTNVAEADIGKIEAKMEASFTVDAFPAKRFKGKVRQIRNAPINVQNVVTYDAVIDVDNEKLELKPGMTATVTFVVAQKDDVLKLPNATLRFRAPPDFGAGPGGKREGKGRSGRGELATDERIVWRQNKGGPAPVKVKVGLSDGAMTEIVSSGASVQSTAAASSESAALEEGDLLVTDVKDNANSPRPGGPGRLF